MKRRFSFRLARVLRVRELEEEQARAVWSLAESSARQAEEHLDVARGMRGQSHQELLRQRAGGQLPVHSEIANEITLRSMDSTIRFRRERALTQRQRAEQRSGEWRTRERERRALQELQERERLQHRREIDRLEAAEMDEAASSLTLHRRTSEKISSDSPQHSSSATPPDDTARGRPTAA